MCIGDSALLAGSYQTTNGIFIDTLQSAAGCDSIVSTELILDTVVYSTNILELCYGDSTLFGGNYYNNSGTYYDTSQAQAGCDSVAELILNIKDQNIGDTLLLEVCDSLVWNNNTYLNSGFYYDTLQAIDGCDSIISLDLTINYSFSVLDSIYRCIGDSVFLAGSYQITSGIYIDTLQSSSGCDSILSTQLTFDTILYSNTSLELCYGDSILFGSNYYGSSGVYYDTLQAAAGCDSVSELVLNIRSLNYSVADSMQRCVGDSALIAGSYQSTSGLYLDTLQSVAGCDSIIATYLTVDTVLYNSVSLELCYGDSILFGGDYYNSNGTYYDTLQALAGCDSVVDLVLTVRDLNIGDTLILTACDSIVWNGNSYDSSGLYLDTLQSVAGCDSIVTLDLTINNSYYVSDTVQRCTGDSAFLAGAYQTVNGTYIDTLLSVAGCDSIVISELIIDTLIYSSINLEICNGDSILFGGNYYVSSGTYYDTTQAQAGCDSLIQLSLLVNNNYFTMDSLQICYGDSVYLEGNYQTNSGVYLDTLQSVYGCDSVVETNLNVFPLITTGTFISICSSDSIFLAGAYQTVSGLYTDTLTYTNGCNFIYQTNLLVDTIVHVPDTITICQNDSILFGNNYVSNPGTYYDTVINSSGCDTLFILDLQLDSTYNNLISSTVCDYYVLSLIHI